MSLILEHKLNLSQAAMVLKVIVCVKKILLLKEACFKLRETLLKPRALGLL